ncbi:alpha/beta-hydrolase, partial [Tothia fuscella]
HASSWQPTVSEYLGIPYAEPPIGPLRFAAPKPYNGSGTIVASKFSPDCPANVANFSNATVLNSPKGIILATLGQYGRTLDVDEDCLSVNVWTKPGSGEKAKAVMLWVYGGGFAIGYTASPTYDGARLAAEQDVVVVSMNYRLNILGFPGAPGLPDQNLGLLDQRLAVEWVRDNIAAFGGDPKRITLFGESAGGASVDMYSYAWTKDPIVNAFIAESGTTSLIDALGANGNKTAGWFRASEKAGCGGASNTTADASIKCMRAKPWKDVLNAIKPAGAGASLGGMGDFGPSPDGKVVFNDYKARTAAGNFIKRPMLVGNNGNEISLFTVILGITSGLSSPLYRYANAIFNCPSGSAAVARMQNKVKAWRYLYSGSWPNQNLADGAGAFHGSEIGLIFGSMENEQKSFPNTAEQSKLVQTMMNAWAGFAKDPENALEKLGWPLYDATKPTVIKLGDNNSSAVTFVNPSTVDTGC